MFNARQHTKHDGEGDRGQAMVEFALVLPILLLVMFGAIEFGRAYWTYQQLSAAASEGARTAIVSRSASNRDSVVINATRNAASNLTPSRMDVTVQSTWNPGENVTVTARYPVKIKLLAVVPVFDDNLVSRRTMRVEQ